MTEELDQKFLKQVRILYVEDEENVRKQMAPLFEKIFKEVVIAVDGRDGLNKYNEGQASGNIIDVIFTDINMPVMNGITFIREVRKTNSSVVVLFATAHNETAFLAEAIKLKVVHYALKPVNVKEALKYIQQACRVKFEERIITNQQKDIEQYLDIINNVAIISKTDLEGNITYANGIFCEVSGYNRSELMGKNHRIIKHPDTPAAVFDDLWKTIKAGKVWKGKLKNKAKDGTAYFVDSTILPIKDEVEDKISGYMAIRFLTEDIESNQQEMMKKVRQDIMAQRTKDLESKRKIKSLETQVTNLRQQLQNSSNSAEDNNILLQAHEKDKKRIISLRQQLAAYESDIKNVDKKVEKATAVLNTKNKDMQDRLRIMSSENLKLKDKVISLQSEINKLTK